MGNGTNESPRNFAVCHHRYRYDLPAHLGTLCAVPPQNVSPKEPLSGRETLTGEPKSNPNPNPGTRHFPAIPNRKGVKQ